MSVYAIVWAYQQKQPNQGEKFTLVTAAQYCSEEGICWVSQRALAEDMNVTERVVRNHLAALEARGLIERKERRRKDGTRTSDLIKLVGFSRRKYLPVADLSTGKKRPHQPEESSGQETSVKETSLNNASTKVAAAISDADAPAGWEFEEYIRSGLEADKKPFTRPIVRRYTRQANSLLQRGEDPEAIYEACDRVISEWDRIRLTLDDAMRDVQNGSPAGQPSGAKNSREAGFYERQEANVDKPRNPGWYTAFLDADEEQVMEWIAEGATHSQIEERLQAAKGEE